MLARVLRRGHLVAGALALAATLGLLALGCIAQLTLSDIIHVPHAGARPLLKMGAQGHGKRGVECADCHAGARTSDRAGMPDRAFCMVCHEEVEEAKEKLALGGPIFDADSGPKWTVTTALPEGVTFSHAKHVKTYDCAECHGDIAHEDYGLVDLAARYANCRRCHRDEDSQGDCTHCHAKLDRSSLPHSHDSRWRRRHGAHVRDIGGLDEVGEACAVCHRTSYCVGCHQEEKPRDHTIFFTRAGHGLAADIDRERCAACHTEDRCVRCHLDGATPRPPAHPVSNCQLCHTGFRNHVVLTDNCVMCHR